MRYQQAICENDVTERIASLHPDLRTIYCMACLTHTIDTVVRVVAIDDGDEEGALWYRELLPEINDFWANFPRSLDPDEREQLQRKVMSRLSDEDTTGVTAGEDPLLTGAFHAFGAAFATDPGAIGLKAIFQAYHAVLEVEDSRIEAATGDTLSEEEIEAVSTVCAAEFEFQLKLLELMESIEGTPPAYNELLRQLKGGED